MTLDKHKQLRQLAHKKLGKYGSLSVTWGKFDCGLSSDGLQNACTWCVICKHSDFLDHANSVGLPEGSTIQQNKFLDKYMEIVYDTR